MLANMSPLAAGDTMAYATLLLQITVFALAALGLAACFRHNAAARYSILYSSLLSLALLCVVSMAIQAKSSGLLLIQLAAPGDYFEQFLPQLNLDGLFVDELALGDGLAEEATGSGAPLKGSPETLFGGALAAIASLPLYLFLKLAWVSGFLLCLLGLLRSLHNAGSIAGRALALKPAEQRLLTSLVNRLGLGDGALRCRRSTQIDSPVLVGILDPILLVPERFFEEFNENEIRAILRHELAHVLRRDSLANFLQKIVLSLFWFHPLVHHMDRMIMRAREEICDNYVLAQERASAYGEVLLRLNASQSLSASGAGRRIHPSVVMGVVSGDWKLEQRIADLLNHRREKLMQLRKRTKILLNASVLATAFTVAACQVTAQDATQRGDGTGQAQSAAEGSALTLSREVMVAISEIQGLMTGDANAEPDWEAAKALLDRLYEERFERMNDFEKSTLLNFYTNYYLSQENYAEAARIFEQMLEIESLRPDIRARALRSLGQLHAALENWSASIQYYRQWQAGSTVGDKLVSRGLSYAYYQLEQFDEAVPNWQAYMELKRQAEEELDREDYAYLNGLYFTLEDMDRALELTKEMILLFNTPTDWENLRVIYRNQYEAAGAEEPGAA